MKEVEQQIYEKYEDHLCNYGGLLREVWGLTPDRFHFGPTYFMQASSGAELELQTFIVEDFLRTIEAGHQVEDGMFYEASAFIFAKEKGGRIVGDRCTELHFNREENCLVAYGSIETGVRQRGYATVIELVHDDFLTRMAGNRGFMIEEYAIHALEYSLADGEMYDRWKALWGNRGRLGCRGGKKVYCSKKEPQFRVALERLANVELGRLEKDGVLVPVVLTQEECGSLSELREQQERDFFELVGELVSGSGRAFLTTKERHLQGST